MGYVYQHMHELHYVIAGLVACICDEIIGS